MTVTTCELLWIKGILADLGISHAQPVDCHFIHDEILNGTIQPVFVPSHGQLEDIFTKSLRKDEFYNLVSKLGIHDLHAPA